MVKKLTLNEIINQFKKVHKNKYIYSKVVYVNDYTKVKIICPFHGDFFQSPSNHKQGHGCKKCKNEKLSSDYRDSIEQFKKIANKVHNFKYDYSKVSYKNVMTKIEIICPHHGSFWQAPHSHKNGRGCRKCGNKKLSKFKTHDTTTFIKDSNIVHDDIYDYSKAIYKNNYKKVEIVCKKHGPFLQSPANHKQGQGCKKCSSSKGESKIRKLLKNNKIKFEEQKTFKKCKYKELLRFDFYLPDFNILIEYDGIQHFKPIDYFGGIPEFIRLQHKDKIKNKFAEENNMHLLRIKYSQNCTIFIQDICRKYGVCKEVLKKDMI